MPRRDLGGCQQSRRPEHALPVGSGSRWPARTVERRARSRCRRGRTSRGRSPLRRWRSSRSATRRESRKAGNSEMSAFRHTCAAARTPRRAISIGIEKPPLFGDLLQCEIARTSPARQMRREGTRAVPAVPRRAGRGPGPTSSTRCRCAGARASARERRPTRESTIRRRPRRSADGRLISHPCRPGKSLVLGDDRENPPRRAAPRRALAPPCLPW